MVDVQHQDARAANSVEGRGQAVLQPAQSRSMNDEVAERLREAILRGDFAPGQPLREAHLAGMLEVSRGPVREALSRLEREGLVLIRRNRGATVARLSEEDLDEVYTLRLSLEELAVRQAVRHAGEADFAALQVVLNELESAVERGISEQEYARLDIDFHDRIYRAAHHKRLYRCWTELRPQIYILLLTRNVANPNFPGTAIRRHKPLLEVLQSRDEERAVTMIRRHVEDSYSLVKIGRYPDHGPNDVYEGPRG